MSERGVVIGSNAIPAEGSGPVIVERHFGVDRPEPMGIWLAQQRGEGYKGQRHSGDKTHYVGDSCPGDHKATLNKEGAQGGRKMWNEAQKEIQRALLKGIWASYTPKERRERARLAAEGRRRQAQQARLTLSKGASIRLEQADDRIAAPADRGRLLTTKEAGKILGCARSYISALVRAKALRGIADRPGPKRPVRMLIPASALLEFISKAPTKYNKYGHGQYGAKLLRAAIAKPTGPTGIQVRVSLLQGGKTLRGAKAATFSIGNGNPLNTPKAVIAALRKMIANGQAH